MPAQISEKKQEYAERMNRLLDTYSRVLFVSLDNVRSTQILHLRRALRAMDTHMLCGKKTLQKRILQLRSESDSATDVDKEMAAKLSKEGENLLVQNLALVFTNQEVSQVASLLDAHRIKAPARIGAISPCEVIVPAGNTGLEPTTTAFFQALSIATKIAKGTVEIVTEKQVLKKGDKCDASTVTLLKKLGISPFFYQAEVRFFFEKGLMFTAEDLQITDETIEADLQAGIACATAASLGAGLLNELSYPHVVADAFKNLIGACVATDYVFDEFDGKKIIESVKSGKCLGGGGAEAPAAAAAGGAAPAAAKKPPTPEPSEDEEMDSLF